MEFENIRLAGVDLDGTLFNSNKQIDSRTREAIALAYKKGVQLVPVTGRPFSGLSDEILSIKEISYAITNNGAEIIDLRTGKPIYSRQISNKTALEIIKMAQKLDTVFEFFADGFGYLTASSMENYMNIHGETPVGQYIKSSRRIVDDVYEFVKSSACSADEIFISIKDDSTRQELENILKKFEDIQYWSIFGRFIEVTEKSADKGRAFRFLADYLDTSIKNTIAFGDGENDISLLKSAGLSVAMENAEPCVKVIADITTASNDNFGVAEILEKL